MTGTPTHHIKVRDKGEARFAFLASGGRTTPLRVHALMFEAERAETIAADIRRQHPKMEVKVQPIQQTKTGSKGG